MKKLLLLLILIDSFSLLSQDSIQISPNGYFDKIFTRYGDSLHLKDIFIDERFKETNSPKAMLLCTSGYFDLYFEVGSGMEGSSPVEIARRNVLCQVFTDISQFIQTPNPNVKVNILVKNINPLLPGYNSTTNPSPAAFNSTLGFATGYYVLPSGNQTISGIVDNEIWKTINSGIDSYTNVASPLVINNGSNQGSNLYHGMVAFNFNNSSVNFNLNLSITNPAGMYDLYSVVLHEVTHALGFASLINVNGNSKFGPNYKYYSRYDSFLKTQSNQALITNSGNCSMYNYTFNPALNSSILSPTPFSCATNVKFSGTVNQIAHTPSAFTNASSLSHLEDICHQPNPYSNNEYYAMSNTIGTGPSYMKRFLKQEERKVLCDIGYKVNTSYGNVNNLSYYNYGGNVCPGLEVVGINDGIITTGPNVGVYQYLTSVGAPALIINNIWANDYNATSFECLEIIVGSGTLSNTSGTSFSFTAQNQGLVLLRYIPVSANGTKGNITFVYIYVTPIKCTPTTCNLLSNGGFENTTTCGQIFLSGSNGGNHAESDCWNRFTNAPKFFKRNCTNTNNNYQGIYNLPSSSFNTTIYDSWNGFPNNTFLSLIGSDVQWNESMQGLLTSPMIPGNTYSISFYAKLANSNIPANTIGKISIGGSSSLLSQTSGPIYNLPNSVIQFGNPISIINNNSWQYQTFTFTYNGISNLNNFVIINSTNFNLSTNIFLTRIFIDDIKIEEVNPSLALTIPNTLCVNQVISNLSIYAPIQGGVFSGNGVIYNSLNGTYSFNPTIAGVGNHQITYTYTNSFWCEKVIYDQIQVVNSTLTASISASSTSVCSGQTISLIGTSQGANSYTWNPGNLNGSSITPIITSSTNFTLTTTNAAGCVANESIFISVIDPPIIQLTPSTTICTGQQVNLVATGAQNFNWSPNSNLSASTGSSVVASPTVTTIYTVTGSNFPGCTANASTTINVINCTDCSAVSTIAGNLSNATYSNTSIKIPNNITISGNVTFTNVNVKIMPGVTITVLPTATLTIIGSHLYGCQNMWEGIKIQSGGKINIQPYSVASVVQKTSLIEDATIALDFAPILSSQTSAVLQVNNATFNKNATSINIQGYTFDNVASIFNIKNSLFTCRNIYNTTVGTWPVTTNVKVLNGTSNPLDKPYINSTSSGYPLSVMKAPLNVRSNIGVKLNNIGTTLGSGTLTYNEIVIGSTITSEYNLFDNLNGGIDALNANFKAQNCKFQDPKPQIDISSIPTEYGFGINAVCNNQTKYKGQVLNECAFYNLFRSIKIDYFNEFYIINNTFRSQRKISYSDAPNSATIPGRYGLYIRTNDFSKIQVINNTLYNIERGIYIGAGNVPNTATPTIVIEQNTIAASYPSFYNATNSVFDAIQVVNVNSLPYNATVNILSNNLNSVYRGILAQTWSRSQLNVTTNTITLSDQVNDPEQYGVAFKNIVGGNYKNTISLNYITGFTGSSSFTNTSGIKIESAVKNHLECNNVYNTYYGMHFKGNTNTTSTKRNTMNNNKYGFVLDGAGVMLGDQGAPNAPCDNIWSGTTWSVTNTPNGSFKTLVRDAATAVNSKMYVRSTNLGIPSSFNPNGSSSFDNPSLSSMTYSPANLALFVASGPATSCNSAYIPEDTTLVLEEVAVQMETAVSTMETSSLSEEELAKQKTDVYRSLDANPAVLLESSNLQAFYDSTALSNKGVLLDAEKASNDGDTVLLSQKLNLVAPFDLVEYNYKLFYNLCLNVKNASFSNTDSLELFYLVSACPDVDGSVVYQARALFNAIYACAETFESNCVANTAKSMHDNTEDLEEIDLIRVYPNPNNGEFDIYFNQLDEKLVQVSIRDLSGKEIYFAERIVEGNVLKISLNATSGLYYLELTHPISGNTKKQKIVILK